jgi:hypothetical protein
MSNETNPVAIVLATSSTNPEYNGECDYAVVRLTPELVDQVRRRVELARQAGEKDNDLYELYFWGGTADYYDSSLPDSCQDAIANEQAAQEWLTGLEQNGHALVPPAADLSGCEPQRTECDQALVRCSPSSQNPEFEIAWTTIPKHSDVYVTTRDLPLAALEGYVRNEPSKDK